MLYEMVRTYSTNLRESSKGRKEIKQPTKGSFLRVIDGVAPVLPSAIPIDSSGKSSLYFLSGIFKVSVPKEKSQ